MATTEIQERDRTRIDEKYKWNIDEVYPSIQDWRAEKDRIAARLPPFAFDWIMTRPFIKKRLPP